MNQRPSAEELLNHPFLKKACNISHFLFAIEQKKTKKVNFPNFLHFDIDNIYIFSFSKGLNL